MLSLTAVCTCPFHLTISLPPRLSLFTPPLSLPLHPSQSIKFQSSNVLFCVTNSPKFKDIQFSEIWNTEQQKILILEILEPVSQYYSKTKNKALLHNDATLVWKKTGFEPGNKDQIWVKTTKEKPKTDKHLQEPMTTFPKSAQKHENMISGLWPELYLLMKTNKRDEWILNWVFCVFKSTTSAQFNGLSVHKVT